MSRLHLTRNLRSLGFVAVVAALLAGIGILWWANRTGLPESWRATIEREAAGHGAHIKIGSLRYVLLQGIVATDVRIYAEPEKTQEISRLERIILDFDKLKLARGEFSLNKVELLHARLSMPVNPKNPDSDLLEVSDANGTVYIPGDGRLEIHDAHGKIAGIEFTLDARLMGFQQNGQHPPDDSNLGKRRALLAKVLQELEKWQFDAKRPPVVRVTVEGNVNDRASIDAKLAFRARNIGMNGYRLAEVTAEAQLMGDLLTVSDLQARDGQGVLNGHADCSLQDREGRFDVSSTLEIPALLNAWLGAALPGQIELAGRETVEAEGSFLLDEANVPKVRMTGHARCEAVTLRGEPFNSVESAFSWRDGDLLLRDLRLARPDGSADAKVIIEGSLVRMDVHSTLPLSVYRQVVTGLDLPINKIVHDFTAREGAAVDLKVEGGFDLHNHDAWAYTGQGSIKNLNYRGVPVNAAQCKYTLNHYELDFYDGTVNFNYASYGLHRAFRGAIQGIAQVGRIRYNAPEHLVEVEDVRGGMWAAPVLRLFAPVIADSLEQYRFHEPPELKAGGVVDVTPAGRTSLDISFSSEHPADYEFLGETITLGHPRGQVSIRGDKVNVNKLRTEAFGGPIAGDLEFHKGILRGEISWSKVSLPELASTYDFHINGEGNTTGRIGFSFKDSKIETMAGEGLVALEEAELFSVPMFGPLSPLIGNVVNDDRAGYQRAKNAFFTYRIRDGILTSNDFQTATKSLNFAGDGSVDLVHRSLDMTMRMNARGLLKLITLPLRPFSGLFQFHGSGPLKDTKWESMKFTRPPDKQGEVLLVPPRATVISGAE